MSSRKKSQNTNSLSGWMDIISESSAKSQERSELDKKYFYEQVALIESETKSFKERYIRLSIVAKSTVLIGNHFYQVIEKWLEEKDVI
jgi:hypothetical protein